MKDARLMTGETKPGGSSGGDTTRGTAGGSRGRGRCSVTGGIAAGAGCCSAGGGGGGKSGAGAAAALAALRGGMAAAEAARRAAARVCVGWTTGVEGGGGAEECRLGRHATRALSEQRGAPLPRDAAAPPSSALWGHPGRRRRGARSAAGNNRCRAVGCPLRRAFSRAVAARACAMQPGRLSRTASGGLVVPVRAYDLLEEAVEAVTPRAARTSLALPKPPPPSKAAVALAALRGRAALVLPSRDVARAPAQIFVAMLAASLLACSRSSAAAFHHHGVWAVITVTSASGLRAACWVCVSCASFSGSNALWQLLWRRTWVPRGARRACARSARWPAARWAQPPWAPRRCCAAGGPGARRRARLQP